MTCDNNEKNVRLQESQRDHNNRQLLQEPQSDRNKHKSERSRKDVTCDNNEKNARSTRSKSNEAKLTERQLRSKRTNKKNEHGNGKKRVTRK